MPYIIGPPIRETERFYGREDLIDFIIKKSNGHAFCIYGLRRIGKTSLLLRIGHSFAETNKKIPIYLSLQGRADSFAIGKALITTIGRLTSTHSILKSFDCNRLNLDFSEAIEIWDDFCYSNALESILLIDEAEQLLSIGETSPESLGNLRRVLIDESKKLRTVITGSRAILQLASIPSRTSPFLHGFKPIPLKLFSADEAHLLITQRNTVGVEEAMLKEIADKCGGHPYFLQSSCAEIYDDKRIVLNSQKDWGLTLEILGVLEDEFKRLTNLEIFVLRNLHFEIPVHIAILQGKINVPRSALEKVLLELSDIGLIKNVDGRGYRLNDIFWELFLNQLISKSIFIAHHRNEADEICFNALKTHLARTNFTIRTEADILPGADIEKSIREEIENAGLIIILLSPDFQAKMYWIIEYALRCKKRIIPIIARPCALGKEIELLKPWPQNGIPLSQQDLDAALSNLPKMVETILSSLQP